MSKGIKYIGLFLVLVYAFFFTSTNFFYHTHQLATAKLVHSHPFGGQGHTHTANQLTLVDIIDSSVYQESADVITPDFLPVLLSSEMDWNPTEEVFNVRILNFSLRAPPAKF